MKTKTLLTFALLLSAFSNIKAQDDANCGIYIDGTIVNKIECWTFESMSFVFPITGKHQKYDQVGISLEIWFKNTSGQMDGYIWEKTFTQQSFLENFGDAKYGVYKLLSDKNNDKTAPWYLIKNGSRYRNDNYKYPRVELNRANLAHKSVNKKGNYIGINNTEVVVYAQLWGATSDGYTWDPGGNKIVKYGNYATLYKMEKVPVTNCVDCPWDINTKCELSGKKVILKIEKSLAYDDNFGLIKGVPISNFSSGNSASEVKTIAGSDNKAKVNPPKTTLTSAISKTNKTLKPLDKTKPGYFEEKDSDGKLSRAGYKKKGNDDDVYHGEVREYNSDGTVDVVSIYTEGVQDGLYMEFDDAGKLEKSGTYKNGNMDGTWQWYTNGTLTKTSKYVNGEEQN